MKGNGFCARRTIRLSAVCLVALIASGCATQWSDSTSGADAENASVDCRKQLGRIDRAIKNAGVADAETSRVDGYPYLRINRHLESVGLSIATPRQARDWLSRLRTLDRIARETELSNLPADTLAVLDAGLAGKPPGDQARSALQSRVEQCAEKLLASETTEPSQLARIRSKAIVPDHYSTVNRTVGLYPLTSLGVAAGVRRWERETVALYQSFSQSSVPVENLTRIGVGIPRAGQAATERLITSRRHDSLGVPVITEQVRQWLLREFAPVFEIETLGEFDRSGALRLANDGQVTVDASTPVIYGRLAFTRYGNQSLIQLIYTVWFSERPATSATDIYAGKLDGVIVRITLDPQGRPAVVDTIHPCGCYHQFFHTEHAQPRPRPEDIPAREEWRFMPADRLASGPTDRLHVSIQSATHYVRNLFFRDSSAVTPPAATLVADRSLTRLPRTDNSATTSLFDDSGLVAGTERGERWLLWPMGIASAGAMRQWGTHATAFVGRRHFDDARLIERRFELR